MNATPGTLPKAAQAHPRRPPAHQSVSLRHSPPASRSKARNQQRSTAPSSPTLASDKANPPSSLSPQLLSNKNSSGESSDAGKWFERTNNDASQSKSSFVDYEPPFFLRSSSSSETPPDNAGYSYTHPPIPYRPTTLAQSETDGSSTEDFRSVIDDLTVANKRLKQKLKKYEKLYDAHLQEEKLFEVRFHGLPDHKKKELEETLRKFASELDDGTSIYPEIASYTSALPLHKTASSTSRFAESGYASVSASGHNSSAPSNQEKDRKMTRSAYSRQQQSIQSYLHDIPMGLLPNNKNVPMTEKSKKKMVVRRLEQIFAGKRSVPGSHSQPMQQQEVSQSAATADREQREATGQHHKPEGLREAHIMPDRGGEEEETGQSEILQGFRPTLHIEEHDFAGSGSSPDQRPTRPLDLDPYRAQVPTENMEYIRHLGFTRPDMSSREAWLGHGWIYLNLLINMAQLHTLNVTPDFVKDALYEYSNYLEISRDGRKIRWKGGCDVTKHSGESSSEYYSGASPNDTGSMSPFKRMKTGTSGTSSERPGNSECARRLARAQREKEQDRFAYKPLFFRKEDAEEDEDYYGFDAESSANYSYQPQQAGNSSGFSSSIMQSSSSNLRRDDGPMIFYTKAKFCTDLSGDRHGAFLTNPGAYKTLTSQPIGATSNPRPQKGSVSDLAESRGPLDASPMDIDSNAGSRTALSGEDIGFSPEALRDDNGNNSPEVMDFEASGLGGVQPEDNFSIHVRRSQMPTAPSYIDSRRRPSLYPKLVQDALSRPLSPKESSPRARPSRVIEEKIISASRKELPASTLPPASFLPFDSYCSGDSSGDVDSDLESDVSSQPDTDSIGGPATAMQILNIAPVGSDESEESDYEDSDDGSVDLLATARQQDPTAVRASEREYDAALADRLAEGIPAGSSAATAGGGSGFNSPAGGVQDAAQLSKRLSETSGSSLDGARAKSKRARTSDSMSVLQSSSPKCRKLDE